MDKTHRLQPEQVNAAKTSLNVVTLSSEGDINNSVVGCYTLQYRTKSCEGSRSSLMVVFVGRKCCGALFIHRCLGCLGSVVKAVSVALYCLFKAQGCFIWVFINLILWY